VNIIKKVLILFGGNSSEHYISCKSAKSIVENIDNNLFNYELVGISKNNEWYIFNDDLTYLENGKWLDSDVVKIINIIDYLKEFDVVFPIIHGTNGEDGKIQGMLELFNIKFVGCKTLSSAIGMDKEMSKILFNNLKINQVPYVVINTNYNLEEIIKKLGLPLIVKPANGGSSIGINKAINENELENAIKEAFKYDKKVIIEKFIKCRELECAVLEKEGKLIISDLGEIKSAKEFYDYESKYENNKSYTTIPQDLSQEIIKKVQDYARKIFLGFQASGLSRIDFFYDQNNNEIYINEINTLPGFTKISMFPTLIENENINYTDLITILINNAS